MEQNIFAKLIAERLGLREKNVEGTLALLDDGATIPFIARYRKERTGAMDEVQIAAISEQNDHLKEIQKRKETVTKTITELGKMTSELERRIADCWDATELEDIYLPYKPKRRTRAQVAREQGLEPLATLLLLQRETNPEAAAAKFARDDLSVSDCLKGAQDIIAEMVSEDERARQSIRGSFRRTAMITSKVVKAKAETDEAAKFSDYFDWSEPLKRCSSHRLLAMRRGEAEGILRISITVDDEENTERLQRQWVRGSNASARLVAEAVADGYKRLLCPSRENEFAASSKEKADEEAIRVFAENLRQLLLGAPLGQKRVMGIDPGVRTGCKVVCLDAQGNLLHHEAIFPHPPVRQPAEAMDALADMIEKYKIDAIAIGNGTASRETKSFVEMVKDFDTVEYEFAIRETKTKEVIEDVSNGRSEIDFLAQRDNRKYYIQVAYSVADDKAYRREFKAFENVDPLSQKILITADADELDYSTSIVRHIHFRDFLAMRSLEQGADA